MKKTLLSLILFVLSMNFAWSQCVPTCSNYAVTPITYTTYPSAGVNAIPSLSPNSDDGFAPNVPIGFNFNFYCTTYSNVLVYSNGLLQFDIGAPSTFPLGYDAAQLIPSVSLPTVLNGIVALRMDDLDPTLGGTITYTTLGTAPNRMFVLTYSAVPLFTTTPPTNLLYSGQIVLYETSNFIDIITISAPMGPNLATQGIENAAGTLATAAPGRNQTLWSATASAYRFSPFTPGPPTSITGPVTLCAGTQANYTTPQQTGVLNYGWTFPLGWLGTSTISAVTATAGASGNVSVTATYTCGLSSATTLSVTALQLPVVSVAFVDPPIVCSGAQVTITPAGALTYTLNPGGATTTTSFVLTASTFSNYFITGSDANCLAANQATASITINTTPTVSVNSGSICEGSQFTITPVSSAGVDGYQVSGGFLIVQPPVGTYSYQVIGGISTTGCNSAPVVSNLTVNVNPVIGLTASKTLMCKDESTVLTATGAATYSWSNSMTTSSISVTPPLNSSTYTVTGRSVAGCSRAKTISVVVLNCTGVNEISSANSGIAVYPNPSTGVLNVVFSNGSANSVIEIFDATGKLVVTLNTDQADNRLNLSEQANGMYTVKIKNATTTQMFKLIKN